MDPSTPTTHWNNANESLRKAVDQLSRLIQRVDIKLNDRERRLAEGVLNYANRELTDNLDVPLAPLSVKQAANGFTVTAVVQRVLLNSPLTKPCLRGIDATIPNG